MAARMRGIPTALHEQNAVLGRANRMLAKRVRRSRPRSNVRDARRGAGRQGALHRQSRCATGARLVAASRIAPPAPGGPLRAAGVRRQPGRALLLRCRAAGAGLLVRPIRARACTSSSRPRGGPRARPRRLRRRPAIEAEVAPFFRNLPELMAASHLVIARAGASSVAELAVIGRPSILVPLPHALDNDQLAECNEACRIGRGLVYRAEGADTGAAGGEIDAADRRVRTLTGDGRAPRHRPRAGPTPCSGSPIVVEELIGTSAGTGCAGRAWRAAQQRGDLIHADAPRHRARSTSSASAASA